MTWCKCLLDSTTAALRTDASSFYYITAEDSSLYCFGGKDFTGSGVITINVSVYSADDCSVIRENPFADTKYANMSAAPAINDTYIVFPVIVDYSSSVLRRVGFVVLDRATLTIKKFVYSPSTPILGGGICGFSVLLATPSDDTLYFLYGRQGIYRYSLTTGVCNFCSLPNSNSLFDYMFVRSNGDLCIVYYSRATVVNTASKQVYNFSVNSTSLYGVPVYDKTQDVLYLTHQNGIIAFNMNTETTEFAYHIPHIKQHPLYVDDQYIAFDYSGDTAQYLFLDKQELRDRSKFRLDDRKIKCWREDSRQFAPVITRDTTAYSYNTTVSLSNMSCSTKTPYTVTDSNSCSVNSSPSSYTAFG